MCSRYGIISVRVNALRSDKRKNKEELSEASAFHSHLATGPGISADAVRYVFRFRATQLEKFSFSSRVERDAAALINHERAPSFLESITVIRGVNRGSRRSSSTTINDKPRPAPSPFSPPTPRNKRNARPELGRNFLSVEK